MATVSKITIGRLFNLGNYEHCRYEISVDLEDGNNPGDVLALVEKTLEGVNPKCPVDAYELRTAEETLAKPVGELEDWEKHNIDCHKKRVESVKKWKEEREVAFKEFNLLGGVVKHVDAKDHWEEE